MCSPSWWASSSSSPSWEDDRRGGQWQQESNESPVAKKEKEKDRFKNVATLGSGKHCLSLEDRRSLLLEVVQHLGRAGRLSRIAVSGFSAMTTHALIYLLCRATPKMTIKLLRDTDGVFTIDHAALLLAAAAEDYHKREALSDPRWVPGACGFRFGSGATEGTGGTRGTGGGGMTAAGPGRARCKSGSDLVQVWLGWGQRRVRFRSDFVFIFGSALDRMSFGRGMGWV
mgnify:CR=1 FL=1